MLNLHIRYEADNLGTLEFARRLLFTDNEAARGYLLRWFDKSVGFLVSRQVVHVHRHWFRNRFKWEK